MGEEELCRLCAETRPAVDLVSVRDDDWSRQELDAKISQFFQIKILPGDKLPTCVCSKCCEKVNITWEFNEKVQQAQETLRSALADNDLIAGYDSDQILAPLVKPIKLESRNSPEDDLVECILFDDTAQNNAKQNMTQDNDPLAELEPLESTTSKKKRKMTRNSRDTTKRKPGRPKGKKGKKDGQEPDENGSESDDDNASVLSGVSDVERNEDGSLALEQGLDGWDNYPWLCADCDDKFPNMMDLRNHHQTVHNQMPKYVCVDCPKIYTKYYGFITHVRCHRSHLRFCCDACSKFFPDKKLLETHRATHFDARPYVCTTCGKGFRMQSALYVHSRSHLPLDVKNKYPCDQCPKRFGTKPNLMAHKRIHTGIRDYTCDQCGKSFIQKGNLDNHLLTHIATRPFSCETCGKAFKTLMRLKKHGSVHSGLKPHRCEVCGRDFRERGTLKEHIRIHTGAMPFKCEFCGKCFRFKGVLTTHRRQHTGERPYSCQECQHHFTNWPNYNKHMKRRHGINTSVTTRKPQTIPPTGMPHRNPPGTVIAPNTQVLIIQDANNMQPAAGYVDHEHAYVAQEAVMSPQRDRVAPLMGANLTGQIVNMQSAHLAQSYYMPGMLGLYNIQGMEPTEIIQTQQHR